MSKFGKYYIAGILVLVASAFPQSTREVLTNAKIIELVRMGLGESLIVAKINQSTCQCDTSTAALGKLKTAKVSDVKPGLFKVVPRIDLVAGEYCFYTTRAEAAPEENYLISALNRRKKNEKQKNWCFYLDTFFGLLGPDHRMGRYPEIHASTAKGSYLCSRSF